MGVKWTSLDAVRIASVDRSSETERCVPTVWISVEPNSLGFLEGSDVAASCCTLINKYGLDDDDYIVEI